MCFWMVAGCENPPEKLPAEEKLLDPPKEPPELPPKDPAELPAKEPAELPPNPDPPKLAKRVIQ